MNNILKESAKQIENELNTFIKSKKGCNNYHKLISKISKDYFLFQESFLKLINNEISIENGNKINRIISNKESQLNKDTVDIYFKYNSLIEVESNGYGFSWNNSSFTTRSKGNKNDINPKSYEYINIYNNIHSQSMIIEDSLEKKIQKYIFKHLSALNKAYDKNINDMHEFLSSLCIILNQLKKIDYNIKDIVLEDRFYSTKDLYDILNKNEIKEVLLLSTDFEISKELLIIKEYNKKLNDNKHNNLLKV